MYEYDKNKIVEIQEFLAEVPENTKLYLGSDSIPYMRGGHNFARYAVIVVAHLGGKHGGKIFHFLIKEKVYGHGKGALRSRLLREAELVIDLYHQLEDTLIEWNQDDLEIHLDLNPDEQFASSSVVKEACGWVFGVTGIAPKIKPESFVASHGSDHLAKYQTFNSDRVGGRKYRKNQHLKAV